MSLKFFISVIFLGTMIPLSFASNWNYQGGDIAKPIGSSRPNVTGGKDLPLVQNLSGTMGINDRLTDTDRLSLGVQSILTATSTYFTQDALVQKGLETRNDFINWRAVYRNYWYQKSGGQSSSEWTTLEPTISTGIGFSITRDIFL
jgi:hypothetical protein